MLKGLALSLLMDIHSISIYSLVLITTNNTVINIIVHINPYWCIYFCRIKL